MPSQAASGYCGTRRSGRRAGFDAAWERFPDIGQWRSTNRGRKFGNDCWVLWRSGDSISAPIHLSYCSMAAGRSPFYPWLKKEDVSNGLRRDLFNQPRSKFAISLRPFDTVSVKR
jgi:hypothetical protein